MKTIGLLGGMTWHSTANYYQMINRGVAARLGGQHSAKILLHSVDFEEIESRQRSGHWAETGAILAGAAKGLQTAGAQCLLLCANTMHKVAPAVQSAVNIPLLHIAEVTAGALEAAGIQKVGLLGTRYTMEDNFYTGRLAARGFVVHTPREEERARVHAIIFEELGRGIITGASKAFYLKVIDGLVRQGAQGIILGCTEIGLLLQNGDAAVPLFDTTQIHAQSAVDFALRP